jgi:hypothetical protein
VIRGDRVPEVDAQQRRKLGCSHSPQERGEGATESAARESNYLSASRSKYAEDVVVLI